MSDEVQDEATHGRRDLIKKAAVAGAVAWTVPAVTSVTQAGAQSIPACEGDCEGVPSGQLQYSSGDTWIVPLGPLSSACPDCFGGGVVGSGPEGGGFSFNAAPVNVSFFGDALTNQRFAFEIGGCGSNSSLDVSFPVRVTCAEVETCCTFRIQVALTYNGPPAPNQVCSAYTITTFTVTKTPGCN